MNILLLNHLYTPEIGGGTTYLREVSRVLRSEGHNVQILVSRRSPRLPWVETIDSVEVFRYLNPPGMFLFPQLQALSARRFYRSVVDRLAAPDLVISRDTLLLSALAPHLGCPKVFVALCSVRKLLPIDIASYPAAIRPLARANCLPQRIRREEFCVRNALTVVFSHLMEEEFRDIYGERRVMVVRPGVAAQRFAAPSEDRSGGFRIVFVGRLERVKRLDLLLRAMKHLPADVTCDIVGDGFENGRLQSLTSDLGLTDCVSFAGASRDTPAHYRAADVFVLPSESESFGQVALEAMAAGLPVITVDSPAVGCNEILEDGITGFKVAAEPASLAERIMNLRGDRALVKRISAENRRRARTFSWEKHVARLLAIAANAGREGKVRTMPTDDMSSSGVPENSMF